ncbi:hypothetical protein [uncultured Methanoregula sp.]|uniref:hypothetical protein n=1 Tax=uncultured Methanoregula sp. TaxID=1005933 RepID=UPI002AAB75D8|nr:hypothetical protein [uncultured Methanoregula sp.]
MILVAITVILAILVLLLFHMPTFSNEEQKIPAIFKIISIQHTDEHGVLTYDSYMVVLNTADHGYKTRLIYAKTYKNGVLLNCAIPTLNGEDFVKKTHHYDVQYIRGAKGETWYAGATIGIDYEDKTFRPGDIVTFDVLDSTTEQIISSHTFKA